MRHDLLACALYFSLTASAMADGAIDVPRQAPLANKLAAPEADVIAVFEAAGMRDIRPHALTPVELRKVEKALAALPPLHRMVLGTKLRHLSFVDGFPGSGSGLTSKVGSTGQFDITLRASLLDESLAAFLTGKERGVFRADGSGRTITIEAPAGGAFAYVLLHEASHVVDAALGITAAMHGPFTQGIWLDRSTLSPTLAASAAARTTFRREPAVPAAQAPVVYDALARTPFVSLYATAAAPEDFAELVTWREIARRFGAGMTVVLRDGGGAVAHRYVPLDFPGVKARMRHVDALLSQVESEAGRQALQRALGGDA